MPAVDDLQTGLFDGLANFFFPFVQNTGAEKHAILPQESGNDRHELHQHPCDDIGADDFVAAAGKLFHPLLIGDHITGAGAKTGFVETVSGGIFPGNVFSGRIDVNTNGAPSAETERTD